jgi:hypothetical protein
MTLMQFVNSSITAPPTKTTAQEPGTETLNGAVLGSATPHAGDLRTLRSFGASSAYIVGATCAYDNSASLPAYKTYMVIDTVWRNTMGSTVGTPQTISHTAWRSSLKCQLGVYMQSNATTTAWTLTVSYTNEDGTPGRTTIATPYQSYASANTGRFFPIALQGTDKAVTSVQSCTLISAPSATFGLMAYRPLTIIPFVRPNGRYGGARLTASALNLVGRDAIDANACVEVICLGSGVNNPATFMTVYSAIG